jgi:prepilin-type processing-associated H-X9-DG protein
MAMSAYSIQHDGFLPMHSSPSSTSPRTRWPDHLWPYLPVAEIYRSPMLLESDWEENFAKPFAHTVGTTEPKYHGGYGYNFQYLGNSRFTPTYHARVGAHVTDASRTIAVADTAGSRKGDANRRPGQGGEAVYVVDPPLGSARGAGNGGAYYAGGMDEPDGTPETYLWRSFPAERNNGKVAVLFVDGHARFSTLRELDDLNNDGVKDNGYWNGHGDARLR